MSKKDDKEIMILSHEEWPGFMVAFLILFPLAVYYFSPLKP